MANALSFLADPEYWRSVRQTAPNSLSKLAQGLATGIAGAPVDLANMAMQPFGIGSERPIGGSNHLAELLNADTRSAPYQIGTMLPVSPTDMVYGLPLLAGIFAGKSAKTADLSKLMKAEELRAAGVPDEKIWGETGWTFGFPDKKPRFEIPDDAAVMAEDAPRQLAQNTGRSQSDIFSHDQLYDSYPESANLWTARMPGEYGGAYTGGVMGKSDMISLGMPKKNIDLQEVKGTNLHELQHAIQQREGFARGGSPENAPIPFMDEISAIRTAKNQLNIDPYAIQNKRASGYPIQQSEIDRYKQWEELTAKEDDLLSESQKISPFEAYRRLAGEAEARLTQARMNLTPEQRLAQYPVSQFDVPVENQIVRYGDDVARSIPNKTEFEIAHEVAQRNAALPLEQGGLGLPANNTAMDRAMAMSATGDDVSLIGGPSSGLRDAYIIGKKTRDVNPDLNTWAYTDEYKDTLGSFPWEENRTPAWEAFYRAGKLNREEPVMAIGSRYGEIPERGTSFNYRDQINERGVSMADVQNSNAAEWGDPISKTIIEGYGRPKINVGGYLIDDVGADGEPLLVAAKRLTGDYVIDSGKKRSRFAAFDPFQRNSANILAGGAAGGIGINALHDLMNQEEYR